MKALVTGGGGFLGLYIVEQLIARNDSVRVLCRNPNTRFEELGVEWHQGDVRDFTTVRTACDGTDAVFHVAALPGVWGPWQRYYSTNTLGTEVVIAACRRAGVEKLIYTSSPSVVYDGHDHVNANEELPYPEDYLCYYPHTKALAERAVRDANGCGGLTTVALRPHLIWGPRDNHLIPRLIQRAKSGRLRRIGDGSNRISMVYVENAAAAHLQAADALSLDSAIAGRAYFINEPKSVNLWDWINELLQLAGLPPIRKSLSSGTARRVGAFLEAAYAVLRLSGEPPMTRFVASQLSGSHCYDVSAAQRDFGYTQIVSVEEGMKRLEPDLKRLNDK